MSIRHPPPSYSSSQLAELAALVLRANPAADVTPDELAERILDLLYAVGTTDDGSKEADYFREAGADDPCDADLVKQFRAIASADDPLDPKLCHGIALAKLNAAARSKWTSRRYNRRLNRRHMLLGVTSDILTVSDRADIKEFALHLAAYHQAQIRRKRPNKNDLDTLLDGLGDLYLSFAELDQHRYALPHAVSSIFIRFCHQVLSPYFDPSEVSPKALSHRWKRRKDTHV